MIVIVCGSGRFADYFYLAKFMDELTRDWRGVIVVSGKQRTRSPKGPEDDYGADYLGERWALSRGHGIDPYPADWSLGKKAGPVRNQKMADESGATYCVAFWESRCRGTSDMIVRARKKGMKVIVKRPPASSFREE